MKSNTRKLTEQLEQERGYRDYLEKAYSDASEYADDLRIQRDDAREHADFLTLREGRALRERDQARRERDEARLERDEAIASLAATLESLSLALEYYGREAARADAAQQQLADLLIEAATTNVADAVMDGSMPMPSCQTHSMAGRRRS